jgi:ankyrin repeat protein
LPILKGFFSENSRKPVMSREVEYLDILSERRLNRIFRESSKHGYSPIVNYILDLHSSLTQSDDQALAGAVTEGHFETAKLLIDRRAEITSFVFQHAAEQGHLEIVKYLRIDVESWYAQTLYHAARNGQYQTVEFILSSNVEHLLRQNAALNLASGNGHVEVVELLLERRKFRQKDLQIPLRSASAHGHWKIVSILLDAGADLKADNNYPLKLAIDYRYTDTVKLLCDRGAQIPQMLSENSSVK